MSLVISSRAVARVLAALIASLVALDGVHLVLYHRFGYDVALGFHNVFSLAGEQNVPTWYASGALLLSGALFSLVAHAKRAARDPYATHWQGLGVIFVVLSVDEAAALHDGLNTLAAALSLGSGAGIFRWGWVLFAMAAVVAVGLAYLRFFLALPPRFRRLFFSAAALFVGGAVGCEMLGAAQWRDDAGWQSLSYALTSSLEETLEMCGIAVLVYALLSYITTTLPTLSIRFQGAAHPTGQRLGAERRLTPLPPPVPVPAYSPIRPDPRRAPARSAAQ